MALNDESLAVLRQLLPDGIFTDRQGNTDGWIEDLTLYDHAEIRLGVITHEQEATLNVEYAERSELRELKILP